MYLQPTTTYGSLIPGSECIRELVRRGTISPEAAKKLRWMDHYLKNRNARLTGRTKWPGPMTHFAGGSETQQSRRVRKIPPALYPRYLANGGMVVLTCALLISLAWTLSTRLPPKPQLRGFIVILILAIFAHFVSFRRAAQYEAEVEWALGRAPDTPRSTGEVESDVVPGYITARRAIRRIWSQLWLVALSGLFIWMVVRNPDDARAREAIAHPQDGPVLRHHAEEAQREERSFYFTNSGGILSPLEQIRVVGGSSLAIFTAADGERLLALLLKRRNAEDWRLKKDLPVILDKPLTTLFYPELEEGRLRVLAVIGEPQELKDFAKGRGVMGILFSVIYVGFSINALYIVGSLRRLVRVTFARKGRPSE